MSLTEQQKEVRLTNWVRLLSMRPKDFIFLPKAERDRIDAENRKILDREQA